MCGRGSQIDLLLGDRVQEASNRLVNDGLSPRGVQVETFVQNVHHIVLANVSKGQDLGTRNGPHALLTHFNDGVPMIAVPRQEHALLHVAEHKNKASLDRFSGHDFGIRVLKSDHLGQVHNNRGSVELVPTEQVDGASLNQFQNSWCDFDPCNVREPFEVV